MGQIRQSWDFSFHSHLTKSSRNSPQIHLRWTTPVSHQVHSPTRPRLYLVSLYIHHCMFSFTGCDFYSLPQFPVQISPLHWRLFGARVILFSKKTNICGQSACRQRYMDCRFGFLTPSNFNFHAFHEEDNQKKEDESIATHLPLKQPSSWHKGLRTNAILVDGATGLSSSGFLASGHLSIRPANLAGCLLWLSGAQVLLWEVSPNACGLPKNVQLHTNTISRLAPVVRLATA